MKTFKIVVMLLVISIGCFTLSGILTAQPAKQLRIMIFGAHPDDPEKSGGTAAKYSLLGHKVCLVSLTNGDAGHFEMGGGALANRRLKEAQSSGKVIGADYIVMDNHDGELMPSLENRRKVINAIREFQPDIVFAPRSNDYHPDHRNTAILVQDASYLVTVPNIEANTPFLQKSPVFMYVSDGFQKPYPFVPDVVVGIDEVIEKKIDMYDCHESQVYEWLPFNGRMLSEVPKGKIERREWLAKQRKSRDKNVADKYRDRLIALYGREMGSSIQYAEAFEASEYGTPLKKENIKELFPFFGDESHK